MYAIVKTGSKQYKVAAGDFINIEKIDGKVGDKIELETIFTSDAGKVNANPKTVVKTKVVVEIVDQFKDKKVIVFKFKKRKNYQRKVGHRQPLTRVKIISVGSEKATDKATDSKKTTASTKKSTTKKSVTKSDTNNKVEQKKTSSAKKEATSNKESNSKKETTTKKATTTKKEVSPKKAKTQKSETSSKKTVAFPKPKTQVKSVENKGE